MPPKWESRPNRLWHQRRTQAHATEGRGSAQEKLPGGGGGPEWGPMEMMSQRGRGLWSTLSSCIQLREERNKTSWLLTWAHHGGYAGGGPEILKSSLGIIVHMEFFLFSTYCVPDLCYVLQPYIAHNKGTIMTQSDNCSVESAGNCRPQ